jgi:tRNA pseudouridine38-40 synthase
MDVERDPQGALALTVSYDGSPFSGFARQPGRDTVQGRLETALTTALRREVVTVGAGRTDAGVHALGQVVSFTGDGHEPEPGALMRSLNALVGEGIVVTGVRRAAPGFSARFDAEVREYRYRLIPGPIPPLFLSRFGWWTRHTLDLSAMRTAARALVGEHDFRSFCVTESAEGRSTSRSLELVEILPEEHLGEHCVTVRIVGNAFLHAMVRVITGSLVEIGLGRRDPEWLGEALAACDRAAAGPTAPACGLTLWHVSYPDECWL